MRMNTDIIDLTAGSQVKVLSPQGPREPTVRISRAVQVITEVTTETPGSRLELP